MKENELQNVLLEILKETQEEHLLHLKLRLIREKQEPTFKELATQFPDFEQRFLEARQHHDRLLEIRKNRMELLENTINSFYK